MNKPLQVIWFKRDLRLNDHIPLYNAAQAGSCLALYVIEPEYWSGKDVSARQYEYLVHCLKDLNQQLQTLGGKLTLVQGDMITVLGQLQAHYGSFTLWGHEETGNYWTFERDKAVRKWCKSHSINFNEYPQHGVWRGSRLNRDQWAADWERFMAQPILSAPTTVEWATEDLTVQNYPMATELELAPDPMSWWQPAGREAGLATLQSFLYERGKNYRTDMSSPILGWDGCSRLSTHLAYGTVSMRETVQTTQQRLEALAQDRSTEAGTWRASLRAFIGRLHWHCHFIQKLETEPELEWLPQARLYTGLRPPASEAIKQAYAQGQTGYPFVDACMRSLQATGWINFRMRAMLMSFACYDLWMPWQEAGAILARLFTDYEAGIHWTQAQMQSGESGINTLRIYSPVKQGYDHDPQGTFIRQWVPELDQLEGELVHEPWKGQQPDNYPKRIVIHEIAVVEARKKIWAIRKTPEAREEAEAILQKHGSRRRPRKRRIVKAVRP